MGSVALTRLVQLGIGQFQGGTSVYAVTPEEVRATAANYLRDEEMTIVVVGDGQEVAAQLKPYGKLVR